MLCLQLYRMDIVWAGHLGNQRISLTWLLDHRTLEFTLQTCVDTSFDDQSFKTFCHGTAD
ncbi:hypothetical protein SAMN04487768_1149 [Burkholderia sp. b13]|nr:hypothetical protein SAMN04487768_1149 [Burkholderia sp. b13]